MWPFSSNTKPRLSDEERIKALQPGETWIYTQGMAGVVSYHGGKCGLCGKKFQYMVYVPPLRISALGPYESTKFGKYKPTTIWYCRSHSNEEIENKIKELDI